jgi:hypothetical protein
VLTNYESNENLTAEENYLRIKERYMYYKNNADLIITSRYHVAIPCNAMGVPVIFVNRKINYYSKDIRLDSLNPNIQLVYDSDYSRVDWNPIWHDFPDIKISIIKLAEARIREAYIRYTQTIKLRKFFATRIEEWKQLNYTGEAYKARLEKFVRQNFAIIKSGRYYIWGAIQLLCEGNEVAITKILSAINPGLEFAGWIDTFKTGLLANKSIIHPDQIQLSENEFIIVAAETAVAAALECFKNKGIYDRQYLILANRMVEQSDLSIIRE